jgi:hypothetical protein
VNACENVREKRLKQTYTYIKKIETDIYIHRKIDIVRETKGESKSV